MPVTKSAIKTLRKEKRKQEVNDSLRESLRESLKAAKKTKTPISVRKAISFIDKAVKKNLFHKNKAARMKSSLTKLAKGSLQTKVKTTTLKTKTATKTKTPRKKASPK